MSHRLGEPNRRIPASAGPGNGADGAHRLGIDDRGGGAGPGGRPRSGSERATAGPAGPGCHHRARPRSTSRRSARAGSGGQIPPGRSRSGSGTKSPPRSCGRARPRRPPAARCRTGQVDSDHPPLRIGQVTWIAPGSDPGRRVLLARAGPIALTVTNRNHGARMSGICTQLHTISPPAQTGPERFIRRSLRVRGLTLLVPVASLRERESGI